MKFIELTNLFWGSYEGFPPLLPKILHCGASEKVEYLFDN